MKKYKSLNGGTGWIVHTMSVVMWSIRNTDSFPTAIIRAANVMGDYDTNASITGAIAGALAARLVKKNSFGFIVNALLGIGGAIIGGYVFDFLNWSPGGAIAQKISEIFFVEIPSNPVDMSDRQL